MQTMRSKFNMFSLKWTNNKSEHDRAHGANTVDSNLTKMFISHE